MFFLVKFHMNYVPLYGGAHVSIETQIPFPPCRVNSIIIIDIGCLTQIFHWFVLFARQDQTRVREEISVFFQIVLRVFWVELYDASHLYTDHATPWTMIHYHFKLNIKVLSRECRLHIFFTKWAREYQDGEKENPRVRYWEARYIGKKGMISKGELDCFTFCCVKNNLKSIPYPSVSYTCQFSFLNLY